MKTCKDCKHFVEDSAMCDVHFDYFTETYANSKVCDSFDPIPKMTNGDKIRKMSNEELADYLSSTDVNACAKDRDYCKEETWKCDKCWLEWLNSEVEE